MKCCAPLVVSLVWLTFTPPGAAQDTVFIRTASGGVRGLSGRVIAYTGSEGLVLESASGDRSQIRPDLIQRVETPRTERHRAADEAYARGEFAAALPLYRQARDELRDAQRTWVRVLLTSRIVACLRALGQTEAACAEFAVLAQTDPPAPYLASMPLAWTFDPPPITLVRSAQGWLGGNSGPLLTLLAASHLLGTEYRSAAISRLQELAVSGEETVRWLATTQLWRTEIVTVTPSELVAWQRALDRMPEELRGGPDYVLGQAWARCRDDQRAVLAWMVLPILGRDQRSLSARALVDAAAALQRLDRPDEAIGLYREAMLEFADTPAGKEAKEQLLESGILQPPPQ